ncbi:acyltransferase [uncultured Mucilaginibacter sp.]|uniref:acyltransferase family protein n=1 Tax=uncultured Mucilaginibacter sp. TaxID=797541 RepID=UPI0025D73845|nr:acyltransferase [uncultured Mucilaginibacter sp.]
MLKELDGFRALAVTLVVLFHVGFYVNAIPGFNEIIGTGYLGVQVFFILSSLLLSRQYLLYYPQTTDKKQYTISFFRKRLLRIVPLYLVSSAVLAILNYQNLTFSLWNMIKYVLFISDDLHINVVTWSLLVEVRFYLLLPVIMEVLFYLKQRNVSVFVVPVVIILYSYTYRYVQLTYFNDKDMLERLYSSLSSNIDCLGWGIIAAVIFEKYKGVLLRQNLTVPVILILLVAIYAIMHVRYHHYFPGLQKLIVPVNNILWTSLITLVMLAKTTIFNKTLSAQVAVYISMLSYSIYLWHLPIRVYIDTLLTKMMTGALAKYMMLTELALVIVVTMIVSALSYRFIEKPFLKKKVA